jgi:single-stranded DNA-specific DHH superfamily exonuclease
MQVFILVSHEIKAIDKNPHYKLNEDCQFYKVHKMTLEMLNYLIELALNNTSTSPDMKKR